MVRPAAFPADAAASASHRQSSVALNPDLLGQVQAEFDHLRIKLESAGIDVQVFQDRNVPLSSESLFPAHWISFHENKKIILYPLLDESRRSERRFDIVSALKRRYRYDRVIDLSPFERDDLFLEGCASLVFDHSAQRAFACISNSSNPQLFPYVEDHLGYEIISFHAFGSAHIPIRHTNHMMSVGENVAIICSEAIPDIQERDQVLDLLRYSKEEVIEIDADQMDSLSAPMLQIKNIKNEPVCLISEMGLNALHPDQRRRLARRNQVIACEVPTIESWGGQSLRSMFAEIF